MGDGKQRLRSIQVLRCVAVLPVVMFHFSPMTFGRAGVDLFFCISGFVMAGLMHQRPGQFALDRFTRIYPPFLAAMIVMFLVFPKEIDPIRLAKSLILWPGHLEIYLYPAWSLGYEAIFYAACVLAMFIGGPAVLLAYAVAFFVEVPYLGSPLVLEFLAGFAIARRQWWALPILLLAATADQRVLWYGAPAALVLAVAVWQEKRFAHQLWDPIIMLGNASYAIYLLHAIVGILLAPFGFTAVVIGCLVAGVAFHFAVEKPLLKATRSITRSRKSLLAAAQV